MMKTTKRKTLLISVALFFVFTFSLAFVGFGGKMKVKAETTNGQYITVEGATLTNETLNGNTGLVVKGTDYTGESYDAFGSYSGRFNGIFSKNNANTVEFAFPNTTTDTFPIEWELTFKVEDVSGTGDYFLIKYFQMHTTYTDSYQGTTKMAVIHVDGETGAQEFRTTDAGDRYSRPATIFKSEKEIQDLINREGKWANYTGTNGLTGAWDAQALPGVGRSGQGSLGFFTLVYEGDVLSVKAPIVKGGRGVNENKNTVYQNIASFDGLDGEYGLPKMAFENGYKISFTSNASQPVMFTRVGTGTAANGVFTLTDGIVFAETNAAVPAWYTAETATPTATVVVNGKVENVYPENQAITFPTAKYLTTATAGDATLAIKQGETTVDADGNGNYTLTAGSYKAVYTGGATGVSGNVVEIPFTVGTGLFTDMDKLISVNNALKSQSTVGRHTGALVSSTGAYNGSINGVFSDEAEVEFLLPDSADEKNTNLVFRIEDASNPEVYFEIEYYYVSCGDGNDTTVMVRYPNGGETKYIAYYFVAGTNITKYTKGLATSKITAKASNPWKTLPQAGHDSKVGGFRIAQDENGFVTVYVPMVGNGTNAYYNGKREVAIVKFDGTSTAALPEAGFDNAGTGVSYGTPTFNFENGYRIKFSSANEQSILFTKVADDKGSTDLALDFAATQPTWYKNYLNNPETEAPEEKAEIKGATLSLSADIAVRFYVGADKLALYEEIKLETTFNGATKALVAAEGVQTVGGVACKVFTLYGIRPDQMGETITATLSGKKVGEAEFSVLDTLEDYSVKKYCDNKLLDATASPELKAVCTALLNYGSAAQQYTGVNSSTLVNANYNATPTVPNYEKTISITDGQCTVDPKYECVWAGANLLLDEKVSVKFYVKASSMHNYTVKITYGDSKEYEIYNLNGTVIPKETIEGEGEYYVITFDKMSAADLSGDITVKIVKGSNEVLQGEILTYSLEAYANSVVNDSNSSQTLKNLCVYLMDYVKAVKAYADSLV